MQYNRSKVFFLFYFFLVWFGFSCKNMADQELVILNQTSVATSNEGKIFQKIGENIEFSKNINLTWTSCKPKIRKIFNSRNYFNSWNQSVKKVTQMIKQNFLKMKLWFQTIFLGLSLEDLIGQLRKSVLRLKADFISEDGSTVNYQAMGNSEAFEEYKKLAGNLKFLDLEALKSQEQERKAFFINLYNVQMIHALVAQENLPDKPLSVQVMIHIFLIILRFLKKTIALT